MRCGDVTWRKKNRKNIKQVSAHQEIGLHDDRLLFLLLVYSFEGKK
jgi:hypothetical protein